jgi:pyruvate,orthophosphate dikinase
MSKYVFFFGGGESEGKDLGKEILGGKGFGLSVMTGLGIPVPPGFTISTDVCTEYFRSGGKYPAGVREDVTRNLDRVAKLVGTTFGDAKNPLLVSVRSGARASMPGMMDTILNLGLTDETVKGLASATNNPRFAWDAYRRFITMYANVVLGLDREPFEHALREAKQAAGVRDDSQIPAESLQKLVTDYKQLVKQHSGKEFPNDPHDQLWGAIGAVFNSWNNDRAKVYRKMHQIPDEWGTACNVQAMVFGNMGDDCATGVCFTRDPSTGEKRFFGEFLPNAQGEDVVAGIRTPLKISQKDAAASGQKDSLESVLPESYKQLLEVQQKLESHFRDMQDIEFTIQKNRLWLLQTRNGKRTMRAAVRIAVDMVHEGVISKDEAVMRVDAARLSELFLPRLDPADAKTAENQGKLLAQGLGASPGYAAGEIVFTADEAERLAGQGKEVILVRRETSPEDIHGMKAARGILTATGGMTSHAAVVARGMGKCCVAGCSSLAVDYATETVVVHRTNDKLTLKKGDKITLDGASGKVFQNVLPVSAAVSDPQFDEIMKWADETRRLRVRANGDTPLDARNARRFGAEGIGLCRTEHMFFEAERIFAVREMILASDEKGRRRALEKIMPMQRDDFMGIFRELAGLPVTIRLLDPPLHEFLPEHESDLRALAKELNVTYEVLKSRNDSLREFNPMLGHRGCRLAVTYPEIYETQARAIALAAVDCRRAQIQVKPEIMIPLVGTSEEIRRLRELVSRTVDSVFEKEGVRVDYHVGTMIELPRACVIADEIAKEAEFFSFGTNDLTQTTWGLSRDDAGRFLPAYVDQKWISIDPFVALDRRGVGELMKIAVAKGRSTRANLKIGICGEHGGEPSSIEFCHEIGLDYVSCSPFRVPTARLAAAQAALAGKVPASSTS